MAHIPRQHNASPMPGVVENTDPVLDVAHEHHHAHLHHSAFAEKGRHDDIAYSKGTTAEPSVIPDPDPMDNALHRRKHPERREKDIEKNGGFSTGDMDRDSMSPVEGAGDEEDPRGHAFSRFYAKYRIFFHIFIAMLFTGWWIAGLVVHRHDMNWIIPFLLWLAIMLRLLFWHVPITIVTRPMHFVWNNTGVRVGALIPEKMRIPAGAALTLAVIIVGAFASPESQDNTRANRAVSLFGLVVFIFVFWATSRNRKMIKWHTVIVGMLVQFIIALFVLRTKAG